MRRRFQNWIVLAGCVASRYGSRFFFSFFNKNGRINNIYDELLWCGCSRTKTQFTIIFIFRLPFSYERLFVCSIKFIRILLSSLFYHRHIAPLGIYYCSLSSRNLFVWTNRKWTRTHAALVQIWIRHQAAY